MPGAGGQTRKLVVTAGKPGIYDAVDATTGKYAFSFDMYVPAVETCMNMTPVEAGARGFLSTGIRVSVMPRPGSDGRYGRIQAINLETKKTVWTERQRAPQSTGVLATAGGLVFAGALDRMFTAYNDGDGKVLFELP